MNLRVHDSLVSRSSFTQVDCNPPLLQHSVITKMDGVLQGHSEVLNRTIVTLLGDNPSPCSISGHDSVSLEEKLWMFL